MEKQTSKRPVGRPRKPKPSRPIRNGIVKAPHSAKNLMELEYDAPNMFKNIYNSFKNFGAREVIVQFLPDKIIYNAVIADANTLFIEIYGDKLNHYYCKKPLIYLQEFSTIIDIFKAKRKSQDLLKFVITERKSQTLELILHRTKERTDSCWTTKLNYCEDNTFANIRNKLNLIDTYPLSFVIASSLFKEEVSSWKTFIKDDVRLEKDVDEPLQFAFEGHTYESAVTIFRDSSGIDLKYTGDGIFSISIKHANLLALATSQVGKCLHIFADEKNDLISITYLDGEKGNEAGRYYVITAINRT